VAVRPSISACALGIVLVAIPVRLQEGVKPGVEALPIIDRLKSGLEGLPQLLSSRLHGGAPLDIQG
jgi:hypothetical protein